MDDSIRTRLRENATGIAATAVTGIWLAALVSGQGWWLPFMLFGYIVIVPLTAFLFGDDEADDEQLDGDVDWSAERGEQRRSSEIEDPLETLRNRYARGELTDEEFEQKLDRLLETETIDDATARRDRGRTQDTETE